MRWPAWFCGIGVLLGLAVFASPAVSQQKRVLMLVANKDALANFDPALKMRLEWQFGAEVTVEQADSFDTAGLDTLAQEHDMVLISESLGSGSVLEDGVFKLQETPVPVISFEAYMWEDAFWTETPQFDKFGNTGREDLIDSAEAAGLEVAQTEFYITADGAGHPMGAGFPEGPLTIHNIPYSVNFGTPDESATVIATADETGDFPSHYVYEEGDTLVDGSSVPATRIALFIGQSANPNANFPPLPEFYNDNGFALIDATFAFTIGPKPPPGDVNQDGTIDLADFTLLADEFLTEGMTRADVTHDMVVDFDDFGAWKESFESQAGGQAVSVPEPVSLALLLSGFMAIVLIRRTGI